MSEMQSLPTSPVSHKLAVQNGQGVKASTSPNGLEDKPWDSTKNGLFQIKIRDSMANRKMRVKIYGWVHRCWREGENLVIILRDGTGFLRCVLIDGQNQSKDDTTVSNESTVVVCGTIRKLPNDKEAPGGHEMTVDRWQVLSPAPPGEIDHLLDDGDHTKEHFDNRHLSIRGETVSKVLKMRSLIKKCLRDHYFDKGYFEVSPPTLLPRQIEGTCIPLMTDYYEQKVQLTMSSQMYLETTLSALGDVYCIAPSYRAEPEATRRHLTEYTHCEAECPFITYEELLERVEDLVCDVVNRVLRSPFAHLLYDLNPEFKAPTRPFRRMNYTDALVWLRENNITKEDGTNYEFGDGIPEAPERKMVDTLNEPILLCRFPRALKELYMHRCPEDKRLTQSVDLLMPNVGEIVGGSMRVWQLEEMLEEFKEEGIDSSGYFWYIDQLKYGSAPHGGYGLGIERFLVWMLNRHHIHEVCLYPRSVERCTP